MATADFLYLCVGFPLDLCSCLELTDFQDLFYYFNPTVGVICLNELSLCVFKDMP